MSVGGDTPTNPQDVLRDFFERLGRDRRLAHQFIAEAAAAADALAADLAAARAERDDYARQIFGGTGAIVTQGGSALMEFPRRDDLKLLDSAQRSVERIESDAAAVRAQADRLTEALARIATETRCMSSLDGTCIGATRSRRVRHSYPPERVEEVACPKCFAKAALAEFRAGAAATDRGADAA